MRKVQIFANLARRKHYRSCFELNPLNSGQFGFEKTNLSSVTMFLEKVNKNMVVSEVQLTSDDERLAICPH